MRLFSLVLSLGVALALVGGVSADEKKDEKKKKADAERTIKGTVCCAKCELKKADKCATVITSKNKDGKETIFWFDADSSEKYHKEICTEAKEGAVVGKVKKDGDKMIITVIKVEYKK